MQNARIQSSRITRTGRRVKRRGMVGTWAQLLVLLILATGTSSVTLAAVQYTYDDLGRLKQVRDGNGNVRRYVYDAVGNILAIESGEGECAVSAAPVVTAIRPGACTRGVACPLVFEGSGLLGAVVTSADDRVAITSCSSDCDRVGCTISLTPLVLGDTIALIVRNDQGATDVSIATLAPPAIGGPGQADHWTIAASRGDTVTISMTRIPNQPDGSSTLDPLLEVYDSRGFLVARDEDGGTTSPLGPGRNAVVRNLQMPATDHYTVVAMGSGGTSGPYALEVSPTTVRLVAAEGPVTGPEAPAHVYSGNIESPTQRKTHAFAANGGALATVEVDRVANLSDESGTLDPVVELRDSRDVLIRIDDDTGLNDPPGPGRNAVIKNLTLPSTDTYTLTVYGGQSTTGPYVVRVFLRE